MEKLVTAVRILLCVGFVVCVLGVLMFGVLPLLQEPEKKAQQEVPPPVVQKQGEIKKVDLPDRLRHLAALTVRVKTGMVEGSGLLVKRGETPYLWTAGYVVEGLRQEKVTKDPAGAETTIVTWSPATIIDLKGDSHCEIPADVIRYGGRDAPALLRLREKLFLPKSTVFAEEREIPLTRTVVYHPLPLDIRGIKGTFIGTRVYQGQIYDVTSQVAVAGSAGGGVFTEEGTCIGIVMRGGANICLILPSRKIHKWAKEKNVAWAIDPSVPMPSEEELKKIPIED